MNILFLAHRVPFPPNKGEKIRTYNQLKQLVARGHALTIATVLENEAELAAVDGLAKAFNLQCLQEKLPFKALRYLSALSRRQAVSVANFYSARLQRKIDRLLASSLIDIIICTSSSMAEYIFRSSALAGSAGSAPRLLMDFMDLDSDKWAQYAASESGVYRQIYLRESRLMATYEARIQRRFEACFFISQAEVDLFQSRCAGADNVHVLGNGIDSNEFYPPANRKSGKAPVFLFTGVMNYKPNEDAVTWFCREMWGSVLERFPGCRFQIVGMNPSKKVVELASLQGVEVTGFVDSTLPFYHEADYFVAPFRMARGVQNKVLQAMACGLPVISTRIGAEGIDCIDGEHILLADSSEAFLDQISALESNPDLRAGITTAAVELIRSRYSWENKLKVLDDIIGG